MAAGNVFDENVPRCDTPVKEKEGERDKKKLVNMIDTFEWI